MRNYQNIHLISGGSLQPDSTGIDLFQLSPENIADNAMKTLNNGMACGVIFHIISMGFSSNSSQKSWQSLGNISLGVGTAYGLVGLFALNEHWKLQKAAIEFADN